MNEWDARQYAGLACVSIRPRATRTNWKSKCTCSSSDKKTRYVWEDGTSSNGVSAPGRAGTGAARIYTNIHVRTAWSKIKARTANGFASGGIAAAHLTNPIPILSIHSFTSGPVAGPGPSCRPDGSTVTTSREVPMRIPSIQTRRDMEMAAELRAAGATWETIGEQLVR